MVKRNYLKLILTTTLLFFAAIFAAAKINATAPDVNFGNATALTWKGFSGEEDFWDLGTDKIDVWTSITGIADYTNATDTPEFVAYNGVNAIYTGHTESYIYWVFDGVLEEVHFYNYKFHKSETVAYADLVDVVIYDNPLADYDNGYNEARGEYAIFINDEWVNASDYGELQYNEARAEYGVFINGEWVNAVDYGDAIRYGDIKYNDGYVEVNSTLEFNVIDITTNKLDVDPATVYNFFRNGFSFNDSITFLLNDVEYNVTLYAVNNQQEYTMEINVAGETYKIISTPTTLNIYSYLYVNSNDVDNLENMRFTWNTSVVGSYDRTYDDIVFTSNNNIYNKLLIGIKSTEEGSIVRYYDGGSNVRAVIDGYVVSEFRNIDFISGNLDNSDLIDVIKRFGTFYDMDKGFDNDDNIKITLRSLIPQSYFEFIDGGSCEVKYNIDFYLGEELYDNILYDSETDFILPSTPISDNEDYVFLGWYYDEELQNKFNLEDEITEDLILYGKFGTSSSGGGSIDDPDESKLKTEYIAYAAIALVGVVVVIGLVSALTKKKSGKKR